MTCTKRQRELCNKETCKICYSRSFNVYLKDNGHLHCWIRCIDYPEKLLTSITKSSEIKCLMKCKKCSHHYETCPYNFRITYSCCYCSGRNICSDADCTICNIKRFSNFLNEEYIQWFIENNKENPLLILSHSNDKYLFRCKECSHHYETSPKNFLQNRGCTYCTHKNVCNDIECRLCLNNRLSSHMTFLNTEQFVRNNNKDPAFIPKSCTKNYIFNCKSCNHIGSTNPYKYMMSKGCIYCCKSSAGIVCSNEHCIQCFNNSFAAHSMSKYWDYSNNTKNPRDVRMHSNAKYYFVCPHCSNKYMSSLANINHGRWCTCIRFKSQSRIKKYLLSLLNEKLIIDNVWAPMKPYRPDFRIDELKLIIEFDGEQHFKQVMNWYPPLFSQLVDTYKALISIHQGYTIIRISYQFIEDNNWEEELKHFIHLYSTPQYILLHNKDYAEHKKLYERYINKNIDILYSRMTSFKSECYTKKHISKTLSFLDMDYDIKGNYILIPGMKLSLVIDSCTYFKRNRFRWDNIENEKILLSSGYTLIRISYTQSKVDIGSLLRKYDNPSIIYIGNEYNSQ